MSRIFMQLLIAYPILVSIEAGFLMLSLCLTRMYESYVQNGGS
jgi:hypothetical protein